MTSRQHFAAGIATSGAWPRFDWHARSGGQAGVIAVLTATLWLNWSSTYYLMTVLAKPIAQETGWSLASVVAGLSLGLVVAGLASPAIGRAIERRGGRRVLALGSLLLAIGLAGVGLAHGQIGYFAAWAIVGIGMAASLYDAAFAALGRLYGLRAKPMISTLMLMMAFTTTFSWPLTALLVSALGWRGACLCYAAAHVVIALPMHFFALPKIMTVPAARLPVTSGQNRPAWSDEVPAAGRRRTLLVWLVGANVTLQVAIGSVLAVHLLSLLQSLGVAYAVAVGLGSVIWLSQGGGRLIEAIIGQRFHPVSEGVAASLFVMAGLALLLAGRLPAIAAGLVLFGLGNGVRGILKGTLPLVLFGAEGYATLIGRYGLPTLIAQAAGPALGAIALARWGAMPSLVALLGLAALNLVLSYALRMAVPR